MKSPTILDTPCREYQGSLNPQGYGIRQGAAARRHGTSLVHRQIMVMAGHDITGKIVMHRCDNPRCFRYDHLRIGTRQENSADMVAKGRATQHGMIRLPEAEIIRLYREGWSLHRVAAGVGCSYAGVQGVLRRAGVTMRTSYDPRPRW